MLLKIDKLHAYIFSESNLKLFEKLILFLAVGGFIFHLALIYLNLNYYQKIYKREVYQFSTTSFKIFFQSHQALLRYH